MENEKQEQGNGRRVLRNEIVEIEGTIDRLEDTRYVIDESGTPEVSVKV